MTNELHDMASMLEWQAKNALDNGRMNVEIDAAVIIPQIVSAMREAIRIAEPKPMPLKLCPACENDWRDVS